MDAWFIWALGFMGVFGIMQVAAFFVKKETTVTIDRKSHTYTPRKSVRKASFIPLAIAVFLIAMASWTIVSTNTVGIFTSAGRPYAATDNGLESKRPWAKKTELDASRQFLRFCGEGNNEEDLDKKLYPKINIKIDGNASATICGTIGWQMKATTKAEKEKAVELFKEFKSFPRVSENLVYAKTRVAIATALATQNPLVPEKNKTVATMNTDVATALRASLGDHVELQSVDLDVPAYDAKTTSAIEADLAQKALTSLAIEKEKTNAAEARANAAIVTSIQDARVLVNKCLDIAKELNRDPGLCMALFAGSNVIINPSGPQP